MGKINWGRVFLGGLVAGLIINITEGVVGTIHQADVQAAMAERNITLRESPAMVAFYLLLGFVYGAFTIWLYAAIRPRYGAGPKTAVCAALAVWFIGTLMVSINFAAWGLFPINLLLMGTVRGLVELLLAALAGAWLYREA